MRHPALLIFSLTLFGLACSSGNNSDSGQTGPAVKSMEQWLALVDSGNYSESWKQAGSIFQKQITDSQWVKASSSVRVPLGKVQSRKLIKASFKRSLPGVPDGEYVVAKFQTSLKNKMNATETVTAALENGQWKVVGYFIR